MNVACLTFLLLNYYDYEQNVAYPAIIRKW